jgi:hypothetical protein
VVEPKKHLSNDEFKRKFRLRLRGFVVNGYSTRRMTPSELGMEHDAEMRELEAILNELVADRIVEQPATNRQTPTTKGPTR